MGRNGSREKNYFTPKSNGDKVLKSFENHGYREVTKTPLAAPVLNYLNREHKLETGTMKFYRVFQGDNHCVAVSPRGKELFVNHKELLEADRLKRTTRESTQVSDDYASTEA